ncbi:GNAT family N-acetyltransferase [Elioraea sp.]|uniref:GNAT family N-acetyltransferase n=1 Tax=Elioraea sp. TaxID=2185103 RepID=UPI0025C08EB5|nr:GNAT family N-acetyltransferase [Elioraea sp.]
MIAPVGPEGAGLLAALHAGGIGEAGPAWDEAAFASLLAVPGRIALVASGAEGPLGFVLLGRAVDEAEIITLAVLAGARRRGIGRALVAEAASHAAAAGATRLFLEVAEDNAAALALYDAAGFVPVGRRRGYYGRETGAVDARVLALALTPSCGA